MDAGAVTTRRPTDLQQAVLALRAAGCVFAEREAALLWDRFRSPAERAAAVSRRSTGEPLEYVVGRSGFAGVLVDIGSPAFVPRRRAEALVDDADRQAVARGAGSGHQIVAVDLGCGCGAIAACLASRHPDWDVHATDVDVDALVYARVNGDRFGFAVHQGDWFGGLPTRLRGACDVIVAHLPYVPTDELRSIPRDFRDHEASVAVDGGTDGLDPWRAVAGAAGRWLAPGGVLLTQVVEQQVEEAVRIAAAHELEARRTWPDADDQVAVVSAVAESRGRQEMGQTLRP